MNKLFAKQRLKYICDIYTGNSIPDDLKEKYPKTDTTTPYISSKDIDATSSVINYDTEINIENNNGKFKRAHAGTTLLCIEGGSAGKKIGLLNQKVAFVNKLCAFKPKEGIYPKYLFYLLQSDEFLKQFYENLNGMIGGVSIGLIREFIVSVPSYEQQIKIANRIDKKISSINSEIDAEESGIRELNQYSYSLVSETCKKGLDGLNLTVSNNRFIGSMPSSWRLAKIKHHCYLKGRIGWQGLTASEYKEEGPYLITGTDFIDGVVEWKTCVHISQARYDEAYQIQVKEGDLLITKDGTVGKLAIVTNMPGKASLNSGIMLIRNLTKKYKTKFLYYCLTSSIFWDWYNFNQRGQSTIVHLYQEQFSSFEFPLPPLDVQDEIVKYLDKKINACNDLVKVKNTKITMLLEYKKSFIDEVITGRK